MHKHEAPPKTSYQMMFSHWWRFFTSHC